MAVTVEDFTRLQSQVSEIKLLLESGQHTIPGTHSTAPVQAQTLSYLQLAKQVQVQEEQAAQLLLIFGKHRDPVGNNLAQPANPAQFYKLDALLASTPSF